MSIEFIDGVFFRGADTKGSQESLFIRWDPSSNEAVISQEVLNGLSGPWADEIMDSLLYMLSDLRHLSNRMEAPVRITKRVGVDDQGRVVLDPEREDNLVLSPKSIQIALKHLLSDINSGVRDETVIARYAALRDRRDEWAPVMNEIDGLLEVVEAQLRKTDGG